MCLYDQPMKFTGRLDIQASGSDEMLKRLTELAETHLGSKLINMLGHAGFCYRADGISCSELSYAISAHGKHTLEYNILQYPLN